MSDLRSRLIRLAAQTPKGPARTAILGLLTDKTAAGLKGPFAMADKRKVTFWVEYPMGPGTDDVSKVKQALDQAPNVLERVVSGALGSGTPEAESIARSVTTGHHVYGAGHFKKSMLIIYTSFWKEGEDRTRDEIDAMKAYLKGLGLKIQWLDL